MNQTELFTRSITGLFIGATTLGAIIYSPWTYLAWLCVIVGVGTYEYLRLTKIPFASWILFLYPTLLALVTAGIGLFFIHDLDSIVILSLMPIGVSILFLTQLVSIKTVNERVNTGNAFYGAIAYIGIPMISGCFFLMDDYSWKPILVPVILIWINDIGAYLIGSKWGKRKIAPSISPGKSIEGTIGGGLATLVAGFILHLIWPEIAAGYFILLGISTPVFALAGDLWESALKRNADVKDSGRLLPGHGGILDRYDSLLFVFPIAALGYFIFVV